MRFSELLDLHQRSIDDIFSHYRNGRELKVRSWRNMRGTAEAVVPGRRSSWMRFLIGVY